MSAHRSMLRPIISSTRVARPTISAAVVAARPLSTSSASASSNDEQSSLTWPEYFSLRHKRRILSQLTAVPTTLGALFGSASYFANLEIDPTQPIFGVDAMFVYIGATVAASGFGYLIGPSIGDALFRTMNRSKAQSMEIMDKRFYEHIKARRVDPSYQSVNNPTPDYYGEKISSLKSYRRWLRDQAAYRRKALHGVKEPETE